MLEETVVIGYGSVKKRDLTGAVSSLKSEDLLKTNPVSINQGLQGKMAGVNVSHQTVLLVRVSISRSVVRIHLLPVRNLCMWLTHAVFHGRRAFYRLWHEAK